MFEYTPSAQAKPLQSPCDIRVEAPSKETKRPCQILESPEKPFIPLTQGSMYRNSIYFGPKVPIKGLL